MRKKIKIYLLSIFLVFLNSIVYCQKDTIINSFFDDGKIKSTKTYTLGFSNVDIDLYKNKIINDDIKRSPKEIDEIFLIIPNNNGILNGLYKLYESNGEILADGNFKMGLMDGEWKLNDKEKTIQSFKEGKRDGEFKSFYNNGNLKVLGLYKQEKKESAWSKYYINGQLETFQFFKDNLNESYFWWYYNNGKLKAFGKYKNGKQIGKWEYYFQNGKIERIEEK